ncbi:MAG: hypothetical protein JNK01_01190 [Devosia sp.]|nr:hypothetical protein [Devosia sp.]
MIRDDAGGISPMFIFIAGSVAFLLIVGAIIWFAIPGASARHHFVSPSGRVALDIGEQCGETCERRVIAETIAADGSRLRRGCRVELAETHPVLLNAFPLWAADEQTVEIVYADADGQGGKFPLNIAADCTQTE